MIAMRATLALVFILLAPISPAAAETLVVDTLSDTLDMPLPDPLPGCGSGSALQDRGPDGHLSLREALIIAAISSSASAISFDNALRNGTITLSFDGSDINPFVDALPPVCNDRTTIDGDIDADAIPDITIDAHLLPSPLPVLLVLASHNVVRGLRIINAPWAAVAIEHLASAAVVAISDNTVEANHIIDARSAGVALITGGGSPVLAGRADTTHIRNNFLKGPMSWAAIVLSTGSAANTTIDHVTIEHNRIHQAGNTGIFLIGARAGRDSHINDVTIRNNWFNEIGGTCVSAFNAGTEQQIDTLLVEGNALVGCGIVGIELSPGYCGARFNHMSATVRANSLLHAPIYASGGSDSSCANPTFAADNVLDLIIEDNRMSGSSDYPALSLIGGSNGAQNNTVNAVVRRNRVAEYDRDGISLSGGLTSIPADNGPARDNVLHVTLSENVVRNARTGIIFFGGNGETQRNHIDVAGGANSSCANALSDWRCVPASASPLAVDNTVSGEQRANIATNRVQLPGGMGNECSLNEIETTPCATCAGDCNGDGRVVIEDLVRIAGRLTCTSQSNLLQNVLRAALGDC